MKLIVIVLAVLIAAAQMAMTTVKLLGAVLYCMMDSCQDNIADFIIKIKG